MGWAGILYHLVCGRPPFLAATPQETIRQICENEPPTPWSINPSIDSDLQKVCLRCLRRDMNECYQTASDLAEDLHRYLNNEPVSGMGSLSVAKNVIRRNWISRDLVSTRHNALFGAIFMTLPHLLVFGLVQLRHEMNTGQNPASSVLNSMTPGPLLTPQKCSRTTCPKRVLRI